MKRIRTYLRTLWGALRGRPGLYIDADELAAMHAAFERSRKQPGISDATAEAIRYAITGSRTRAAGEPDQ